MRRSQKKVLVLGSALFTGALLSALVATSCSTAPEGAPADSDSAVPEALEAAALDVREEPFFELDDSGTGPSCPTFGRGPGMLDLGPLCIDSTEVTAGQYRAFLASKPSLGSLPSACSFKTEYSPALDAGDAHPVTNVDWCDAYGFCAWSGKHLCGKVGGGQGTFGDFASASKDQWQHACSGNGAHVYPYGDAFDGGGRCNDLGYAGDGGGAPIPVKEATGCVGIGAPSSGLHDMAGNVWEWEDACEVTADAGSDAGSADRCRTRGGAFDSTETETRCDFDMFTIRASTRESKSPDTGFRCCSR